MFMIYIMKIIDNRKIETGSSIWLKSSAMKHTRFPRYGRRRYLFLNIWYLSYLRYGLPQTKLSPSH